MAKTTSTKKTKTPTKKAAQRNRGSGGTTPKTGVVDDVVADGFFAPLSNDHPFIKAVILGNATTGKSTLAARLAIGLHRRIASTRPIAIVETEHAAHHLLPALERAGIPAVRRVTRSLADWVEAVRRAVDGGADIVVTDSLTHFWEDLQAAYVATTGRTELAASDWVALKAVWHREWSALFRSAPVHIICCARAADEYVDVVGDDGRVTSIRAGIKPRGEAEVVYEPSLLLELRRTDDDNGVVRTCKVLKDRKDKVDGKVFVDAGYADFAAVVEATLAGATAAHVVEETSSAGYFAGALTGGVTKQTRALVGEVKGELARWWPSSAASDKQARAQALHHAFGHGSWGRLEATGVEQLDAGLRRLRGLGGRLPTTTTSTAPTPEQVIATIRKGLEQDPGDPTQRHYAIAAAQTLGSTLADPVARAQAQGVIDGVRQRWEQADFDQRVDELPY
jgi:hypothetical protein